MNHALQPYTPTAHPLNYDALAGREGCEPESGSDYLGFLAFVQLCVFSHSQSNAQFNQPNTVSYAPGPFAPGEAGAQLATWTAWVSSQGIRIGKVGIVVPPQPTLGSASDLYPTTRPSKLAHAFDANGRLFIGIEKSPGFNEIRWYTSEDGQPANLTFPGYSPLLFNYANVAQNGGGMVCLYLRSDRPFVLFTRFASEGFAVEHVMMPDLRANLTRLVSISSVSNVVRLYAIDDLGRDVTLTSPAYVIREAEKATVATSFVSGAMLELAAIAQSTSSKSKFGVSFERAAMFDATAETVNSPLDKAVLGISFESAEMEVAQ